MIRDDRIVATDGGYVVTTDRAMDNRLGYVSAFIVEEWSRP